MSAPSAGRILVVLMLGGLWVASSGGGAQADALDREMEAWVKMRMQQARATCGHRLAIERLPTTDIDFITRYGTEKWSAFGDCVRGELGLDERWAHPPPGR